MNRENLKKYADEIGVKLDDIALERFSVYCDFLVEYNKNVNLTAITDPDEIIIKHFTDSLEILKYCDIPEGSKIADVGTGAGFPAIPILIARPDLKFTLIEATNKKLVFIEKLLEKLGLSAELIHMRGEEAGRQEEYREQFDYVTARAVAELRTLSEYCLPLVKIGGKMISLKGSIADEEISNGKNAIKILGGKISEKFEFTLPNGDMRAIIIIEKIKTTAEKYPRASTLISKKPL